MQIFLLFASKKKYMLLFHQYPSEASKYVQSYCKVG